MLNFVLTFLTLIMVICFALVSVDPIRSKRWLDALIWLIPAAWVICVWLKLVFFA